MVKSRSLPVLAGVAAVMLLPLFATSDAQANPFFFTATGGCSEACAANALSTSPAERGSACVSVSSIEITPSGSVGSPSLTSQAGSLINVTPGGAAGTPVSGNPTHWGVGVASTHCSPAGTTSCIALETAGPFAQPMNPIDMIIGPAPYTNSNASIGNFNPYINGTGTFVIADSAITATTTITGVTFDFGTGPDTFIVGVPAPLIGHGLLVLLAVGGALFGGKLLESLKKNHLPAA
jgi:hypothetical protein